MLSPCRYIISPLTRAYEYTLRHQLWVVDTPSVSSNATQYAVYTELGARFFWAIEVSFQPFCHLHRETVSVMHAISIYLEYHWVLDRNECWCDGENAVFRASYQRLLNWESRCCVPPAQCNIRDILQGSPQLKLKNRTYIISSCTIILKNNLFSNKYCAIQHRNYQNCWMHWSQGWCNMILTLSCLYSFAFTKWF